MRTSFQNGCLRKEERQRGPAVWVYRWREQDAGGSSVKRKIRVGSLAEFPTQASAKRALAKLELNVNEPKRSDKPHPATITLDQLGDHYEARELSAIRRNKTEYTCAVYRDNIRLHIRPRWGSTKVADIFTSDVEDWLHGLSLANGTKAKVRNVFSTILNHGIRHRLATANVITGPARGSGVRQSAKRVREPEILTSAEIVGIMAHLSPLHSLIVLLLATTGLRFSELRGLQWQDFAPEEGELRLVRGVVQKFVTPLKSASSRKPVPLHPVLVSALSRYRAETPYRSDGDWIFASPTAKGRVPIWPISLLENYIKPAAKAANVKKRVSFHTFRHSLATNMKAAGEDVKTVQDTLRHATSQITMNIYTQGIPEIVRAAHLRVTENLIAETLPSSPKRPSWTLIGPGREGRAA